MRASTRQAAASRYRRTSLSLSHPRVGATDRFEATVAQVRREGVRGDIAVGGSSAPAVVSHPVRRLSVRAVSALAAVLATALGVGIFSSTAYFTDRAEISASVVVGTADLEMRSVNGATLAAEPLVLQGLVPLSSTAAADNTRGGIVSFKLKPATLDTRAVITAQGLESGSATGLMNYVRVNFSTDGGTTWTAAQPLTTSAALRSGELVVPRQPATSTTLTGIVKVRFYLTSDAPDSLQGKALAFSLGVRSIQSSAPAGTTY